LEDGPCRSLDNLDDAACSRFDQNCTTVHHGVSTLAYAVFRRHIIVSNAFSRENRTDSYILAILIGWASLFDDIRAEAGTLVYPADLVYTPNHASDYAAYNRPDRASRSFTPSCTPLDSTGDAWRLTHNWKKHRRHNSSSADKTADHGKFLCFGGLGEKTSRSRRKGSRVLEVGVQLFQI
jgi:hypothetical protein